VVFKPGAIGFQNPPVGLNGTIARTQFKSVNYVPGVSGWAIFQNGNAEFNNGIFRGTITASVFQGTSFVINQNGIFFYYPTPGAGNLVISIATVGGTDQYGNAYPTGVSLAGNTRITFPANPAIEQDYGFIQSAAGGTPPATFTQTFIVGPQSNAVGFKDRIASQYNSSNHDGSSHANFNLAYVDNAGSSHFYHVMDINGVNISTGKITGIQPGTSPAIQEGWHAVTLPTGWTGTARVKILAEQQFACFDFQLNGAGSGTTFGTFPSAAYYPTIARHFPVAQTGSIASPIRLLISPSPTAPGLAQVASTIPASIGACIVYPLD